MTRATTPTSAIPINQPKHSRNFHFFKKRIFKKNVIESLPIFRMAFYQKNIIKRCRIELCANKDNDLSSQSVFRFDLNVSSKWTGWGVISSFTSWKINKAVQVNKWGYKDKGNVRREKKVFPPFHSPCEVLIIRSGEKNLQKTSINEVNN